jgi:Cof subfamily protein (haloacid dehalogenase superfamily)
MAVFPFRLAAVDLDDTLLGPDKRVGGTNRDALERLQSLGCEVILASGRRHDNMLPFCRELGLCGFVVSCQGAAARHARTGQFLHHAPLDPTTAAEVTASGLERRVTVMYWSNQGVCASERSPWVRRYEADCGDPVPVQDVKAVLHRPAEKIIGAAEPPLIASLAPHLRRRYEGRLNVIVTDDWFLEFSAIGATKAAGVAAVARSMDVSPERVLAFGDGNNDVPMLRWAGLGVAMSHARPSARSAARMVAPDGDPETSFARAVDGVVKASVGITGGGGGSDRSRGRRQDPATVGHAAARWSPQPGLAL